MADILVRDASGMPYTVRIAGEVPTDAEQARINGWLASKVQAVPAVQTAPVQQAPARGGIGDLFAGVGRGFGTSFTELPAGLVGLGESILGKTPGSTSIGAAAQDISEKGGNLVRDIFGEQSGSGWEMAGETVGSLGSFIVPSTVAFKAARALGAGMTAAQVAAAGGASAMGAGLGASEQLARIEQRLALGEKVTDEQIRRAVGTGGAIGLTEGLPVGIVFGQLFKVLGKVPAQARDEAIRTIGGRLAAAGKAGLAEGAQELTAGILQDLTEKGIYNPDLKVGQSAASDLAAGGGAGAAMQFLLDSIRGRQLSKFNRKAGELMADQAAEDAQRTEQIEYAKDVADYTGSAQPVRTPEIEAQLAEARQGIAAKQAEKSKKIYEETEAKNSAKSFEQDRIAQEERIKQEQRDKDLKTAASVREEIDKRRAAEAQAAIEAARAKNTIADTKLPPLVTEPVAEIEQGTDKARKAVVEADVQLDLAQKDIETDEVAEVKEAVKPVEPAPRTFVRRRASDNLDIGSGYIEAQTPDGRRVAFWRNNSSGGTSTAGEYLMAPLDDSGKEKPSAVNDPLSDQTLAYSQKELIEKFNSGELDEKINRLHGAEDIKRSAATAEKPKLRTLEEYRAAQPAPVEPVREKIRPYSQEYLAKQNVVLPELRKALVDVGLDDKVDLVAESLLEPDLLKGDAPTLVEGYYNPKAEAGKRVIAIAMDIYDPKMSEAEYRDRLKAVINHETIHALRDLGLFSESEWRDLTRAASETMYVWKAPDGSTKKRSYTYLEREMAKNARAGEATKLSSQEAIEEEAVAEMFRDFMDKKINPLPQTRRLFGRVVRFFKAIFRANKAAGFTKATDIFEQIKAGEIGKRSSGELSNVPRETTKFSAAAPVNSPEFRAWFGDSKVVDKDGKPKVVYHSTNKTFDRFDPEKVIGSQFWFTDDLQAIKDGEVGAAGRGVIMPVYLSLKNPAGWKEYERYGIDELIGLGFDGLDLKDDPSLMNPGTRHTYVVFNPTQIKSIENQGTFDANDPRIKYSTYIAGNLSTPDIDKRVFHSGLSRAIHNAKQASAPPKDWKSIIRKLPGVKQDEINWSRVDRFLDFQEADGVRQLSKQALAGYVADRLPEMLEFQKGEIATEPDPTWNEVDRDRGYKKPEDGLNRHDGYVQPGGSNQREILLTIPTLHTQSTNSDYMVNPFVVPSHYEEENNVVHARVNDRTDEAGNKVLFAEEVQSDLGTRLRKHGNLNIPPLTEEQKSNLYNELDFNYEKMEALQDAKKELIDNIVRINREISPSVFGKVNERIISNLDEALVNYWQGLSHAQALHQANRSLHHAGSLSLLTNASDYTPEAKAAYQALVDNTTERIMLREDAEGIHERLSKDGKRYHPDMPFKDNKYYDLMAKRLLKEAAANGYQKLAWTPGYVQAKRWGEAVINEVSWYDDNFGKTIRIGFGGEQSRTVDHDGDKITGTSAYSLRDLIGKKLSDLFSPSIVEAINSSKSGKARPANKLLANSGYGVAYDSQMVKAVNKLVKPSGVQVSKDTTIDLYPHKSKLVKEFDKDFVWSVPITDKLRSELNSDTLPMFSAATVRNDINSRIDRQDKRLNYSIAYDRLAKALKLVPFTDARKAEKRAQWFITKFQDRMVPIGKIVDELRAQGVTVTDAMDVYRKEMLYHGFVGAETNKADQELYEPIIKALEQFKVHGNFWSKLEGVSEFARLAGRDYNSHALAAAEAYLYARHAPERNAYIRTIDKSNDSGSGMTDKEAADIINWFNGLDSKTSAALRNIAKLADNIVKDTNDRRFLSGLIPDFSSMKDGGPQFKNFVTLRGTLLENTDVEVDDSMYPNLGLARAHPLLGASGREDRRMLGRGRPDKDGNVKDGIYPRDIISNLMAQNTQAIQRSERNKVGLSMLELIRNSNGALDGVIEIVEKPDGEPGKPQTRNLVSGKVRRVAEHGYRDKRDRYFVVKENGKEIIMEVADPRVAQAMNGTLSTASMNPVIRTMAKFNRYLANINTSWNPDFVFSNFPRDIATAMYNVGQYDIAGINKQVAKNIPAAAKGIYNAILGDGNSEMAKVYRQYVAAGGQNSLNTMTNLEGHIDKMKSRLNKLSDDATKGNAQAVKDALFGGVGSVAHFLENINTVAENASRLALFKVMIDNGVSVDRAAAAARDITTNFAKGGEYKTALNSMYLFYNASLQGSMAILNATLRNPKRLAPTLAKIVAFGAIMDQLNSLFSDEDDDGKKVYDKINDYTLEHNLIIPDPFGITERSFFRIPIPYGLNMFFNAGRAVSRIGRGEYRAEDATNTIVGSVLETINPFGDNYNPITGEGSPWTLVSPTFGDPVIQYLENKDFADRPIYMEKSQFGVSDPQSSMYWGSTNPNYVAVAKFLNKASGGTDSLSGLVDWSPDLMEFWVSFFTGAMGDTIVRTAGLPVLPFKAMEDGLEDDMVNQIPLIRKLVFSVSSREDIGTFASKRDDVLMAQKELRDAVEARDPERVANARERFSAELRIAPKITALNSLRNKLRKQRDKIENHPTMSDAQKKVLMNNIDEKIKVIVFKANKIMEDI